MELQWPLILFTLFTAWSAGLFATQALLALKGGARKAQLPALITSIVLLGIGGIAVFTHLQHWERIFNGFGNPTSGITQELVLVVAIVVVMIAYFVCLRREEGNVPKWLAIAAIVVSAALVVIMSHSYNMAARPAWDSPLLWFAYLGNAALFGPLTMTVIVHIVGGGDAKGASGKLAGYGFWGAIANAVLSLAYSIAVFASGSSFSQVGLYWDPTHPNNPIADPTAAANVLSGDPALTFWIGVAAVGCVIPLVCAFLAKRKPEQIKALSYAGLACAVVGAVCLRVMFYQAGASVFMFY